MLLLHPGCDLHGACCVFHYFSYFHLKYYRDHSHHHSSEKEEEKKLMAWVEFRFKVILVVLVMIIIIIIISRCKAVIVVLESLMMSIIDTYALAPMGPKCGCV